jgi:hypothetical protein
LSGEEDMEEAYSVGALGTIIPKPRFDKKPEQVEIYFSSRDIPFIYEIRKSIIVLA